MKAEAFLNYWEERAGLPSTSTSMYPAGLVNI